jgi:hypothetical protein
VKEGNADGLSVSAEAQERGTVKRLVGQVVTAARTEDKTIGEEAPEWPDAVTEQ